MLRLLKLDLMGISGARSLFSAKSLLAIVTVSLGAGSALHADPILLNGSFESPAIGAGNFQEASPPTDWTAVVGSSSASSPGAGIVANGSAYANTPAPDGTQAMLVKSAVAITQQLSGFVPGGIYSISFSLEGRNNQDGGNPINVLVDGANLLSVSHDAQTLTTYTPYTTAPFVAGSSTPTLEFDGTSGADQSSFIDAVTVNTVSTPEPASLSLLGLAGLGLMARRRRA